MTRNKTDRDYFRELRRRYHMSIRNERSFYWLDRLKPAVAPEEWLTLISDGAAQKWYSIPRSSGVFPCQRTTVVDACSGTDLGRNACQLKLVGTLLHSHVLVLHIVHPHVPDNANLVCHVLDESLAEVAKVRAQKNLNP